MGKESLENYKVIYPWKECHFEINKTINAYKKGKIDYNLAKRKIECLELYDLWD